MVVRSTASVNDLQEIATMRYEAHVARVYWKKETRQVVLLNNGIECIQPDGPIRESLAALFPAPFYAVCCLVFNPDGTPGLPLNEPNDLFLCEWSDFACDHLMIQATLSA